MITRIRFKNSIKIAKIIDKKVRHKNWVEKNNVNDFIIGLFKNLILSFLFVFFSNCKTKTHKHNSNKIKGVNPKRFETKTNGNASRQFNFNIIFKKNIKFKIPKTLIRL